MREVHLALQPAREFLRGRQSARAKSDSAAVLLAACHRRKTLLQRWWPAGVGSSGGGTDADSKRSKDAPADALSAGTALGVEVKGTGSAPAATAKPDAATEFDALDNSAHEAMSAAERVLSAVADKRGQISATAATDAKQVRGLSLVVAPTVSVECRRVRT